LDFARFIETGLTICPKCEEPFDAPCRCIREANARFQAEESERERKIIVEKYRDGGITSPLFKSMTFENDIDYRPDTTSFCKQYVKDWTKNFEDNIGLLFYGPPGTSKTFFACAIANAVVETPASVWITDFSEIIRNIYDSEFGDKDAVFQKVRSVDLLVLDDIGNKIYTASELGQITQIIEARYRMLKPLIATTNLTPEELENPKEREYKRIYDKTLEMCCERFPLIGESIRPKIARIKREKINYSK